MRDGESGIRRMQLIFIILLIFGNELAAYTRLFRRSGTSARQRPGRGRSLASPRLNRKYTRAIVKRQPRDARSDKSSRPRSYRIRDHVTSVIRYHLPVIRRNAASRRDKRVEFVAGESCILTRGTIVEPLCALE